MFINDIFIDGFGIHHKLALNEISPGLNILYGMNESGKSTLLAFLRACLFDINKKKGQDFPYAPLNGGNHGGFIEITDSNAVLYKIERDFTSKKRGLKLFAADGTELGSDELDRIIPQKNKFLFENVFAFGLDELRELKNLEDDQVKSYIYGASLGIESKSLQEKERVLSNNIEKIYKPQGRTQVISNIKKTIEEINIKISIQEKDLEEYNYLLQQFEILNSEIVNLKVIEQDLLVQDKTCKILLDQCNNVNTYIEKKDYLRSLPDITEFNIDLVEKYKIKKTQQDSIANQIENNKSKINIKNIKIAEFRINEILMDNKAQFQNVSGYERYISEATRSLPTRKDELTQEKSKILSIKEKIDDYWTEDEIKKFDVSIESRDFAIQLNKQIPRLDTEMQKRTQEINSLNKDLEKSNNESTLCLEEQRRQKFNSFEDYEYQFKIFDKLKMLKNQYAEIMETSSSVNLGKDLANTNIKAAMDSKKIIMIASIGVIIISIIVFLAGLINVPGLILTIFSALVPIVIVINSGINKSIQSSETSILSDDRVDKIKIEIKQIAESLLKEKITEKINIAQLDQLSIKQDERFRRFDENQTKLNRFFIEKNSIDNNLTIQIESLNSLIQEKELLENSWKQWLLDKSVPETYTPEAYLELFDLITKAKVSYGQVIELEDRINKMLEQNAKGKKALETFITENNLEIDSQDFIIAVSKINKEIQENIEKKADLDNTKKAAQELEDELSIQINEYNTLEKELAAILKESEVSNENELDKNTYIIQDKKATNEELSRLLSTLSSKAREIGLNVEEFIEQADNITYQALTQKIEFLSVQKEDLKSQIGEKQEELGSVKSERAKLKEKEGLSDLLNQKEVKIQELNDNAKAWIIDKALLRLIEMTKVKYESEKQPSVIKEAGSVFNSLTGNTYTRIIKPLESDAIKVEDINKHQKTVTELSQGTKEQLYLALRLGYIKEYCYNHESLPLIFDDILVNFDSYRCKSTLKCLSELSRKHQIFFFTCHNKIIEYLEEQQCEYNLIEMGKA